MRAYRWVQHFRHELKVKPLYFTMLACFLAAIVPVAIIGGLVYYGNLSLHKAKLLENLSTQLNFSAKSVDAYLRTTEQVAMNFFMSETVQQHLLPAEHKTEVEKTGTSSIIKVLASSRNMMNSFIDDMFVYTDRQSVYLSSGTENYSTFFTTFNRFEQYDESFWNDLLLTHMSFQMLPPTTVIKAFTGKSATVVPIVFKQYIRGHQAVMVVTISTRDILNTLRLNALDPSIQFTVTDYMGNVVASSFQGNVEALSDLAYYTSHAELNVSGEDYLVTRVVSDYGWGYYSMAPKHIYYNQAGGILQLTSWFCLLLVAAGIVLSFVFSHRLYSPIQALLDDHRERELFSDVLLENVFHYIVQGHRPEHFEQIMRSIGFDSGNYLCVCIKFEVKEAFLREVQDTERELILDKLKKVIEAIFSSSLTAHVVEAQPHLFVVMVNLKHERERGLLDERLVVLTETFRYDLRYCRLSIGVGKVYPTINGLSDSLDDARMALIRSDSSGDVQMATASAMPATEALLFSYMDENKLLNGLKARDEAAVTEALNEVIARNIREDISSTSMHLLLIELYNVGLRLASDRGLTVQQLIPLEKHRLLSGKGPKIFDFQAHVNQLRHFYQEVVHHAVVPEETKASQLVQESIAYIEANYMEDLYLDKIAAELGLSSKYFSRIFKETTGRSLTDYISMLRMDEAKRLLATTRLKNDDIAQRVGIVSRATFFRVFKKYEGITPQEYRNHRCSGVAASADDVETGVEK